MQTRSGPLQAHVDTPRGKVDLGVVGMVGHTRLTYLSSRATAPPDVLVIDVGQRASEYEIVAGLDVVIPKNVVHEILSTDPSSLRILARPPHDVVTHQLVGYPDGSNRGGMSCSNHGGGGYWPLLTGHPHHRQPPRLPEPRPVRQQPPRPPL